VYHRVIPTIADVRNAWNADVWRRAFAAAAAVWPVAMLAATRASGTPSHGAASYVAASVAYYVSSLICHQRPERSFHFWGAQFPVCARCAGIYAAAAVSAIAALARPRVRPRRAAAGISDAMLLAAAALPSLATLVFEWTTGVTPSNGVRAAAGVPIGAAVAWVVMRVM
jgi:uncharacterized membrane protein